MKQSQLTRTIIAKLHQFKGFIFVLIFMFGFFRPFIVDAYLIPSGSMEDTLLIGDRILVCKFMYGVKIPGTDIKVLDFHEPARGDVSVFIPPHERDLHFVKRIVAIEGDTVYTKGKDLYVNGDKVDDDVYTKHLPNNKYRQDFPPFRSSEDFLRHKFADGIPFIVPKGKVFAMGDNRDLSSDSRTWGPVDVDDIKGQAFMVMWSTANLPMKLWEVWKLVTNIRFNRIGKLIR